MSREVCSKCKRPIKACYCHCIKEFDNKIEIIILQHPSEKSHPLGTAQIIKNSLKKCSLYFGEDFTRDHKLKLQIQRHKTALLFLSPTQKENENHNAFAEKDKIEQIIVLDGTWRKAKKIYHLNPFLQTLPHISISHEQVSNYRIRKAPKSSYLSTIEAIVYALSELNKDQDLNYLLDAFNFVVDYQIECMGKETFEKNYFS